MEHTSSSAHLVSGGLETHAVRATGTTASHCGHVVLTLCPRQTPAMRVWRGRHSARSTTDSRKRPTQRLDSTYLTRRPASHELNVPGQRDCLVSHHAQQEVLRSRDGIVQQHECLVFPNPFRAPARFSRQHGVSSRNQLCDKSCVQTQPVLVCKIIHRKQSYLITNKSTGCTL